MTTPSLSSSRATSTVPGVNRSSSSSRPRSRSARCRTRQYQSARLRTTGEGRTSEGTATASGMDHPPIATLRHVDAALPVALLVVIAVGKERPQLQRHRRATHQKVGQHPPGAAILHPDALFGGGGGG